MDIELIKELAMLVREMELGSLEVEEGDVKIRIQGALSPAGIPAAPIAAPSAAPAPAPQEDAGMDFNAIHTVTSPMVGVFYAAVSPEKPPFVQVGSKVKKGDVLCIIEAMKLMNEITCDRDGEVVDICAGNGDVVEYGQTLFKIF
ncbi:MAG: acetyl-CoA carboxylase biotin carboxyl carrier protein [Eubacteriales bacterium]|nr:acetyl-CoA carboxylase biotin carboxyl carrier protein [Eubacteriales bacterium]